MPSVSKKASGLLLSIILSTKHIQMISKSLGIILQAQDSRQSKGQLRTTFKTADPTPLQHTGNRGKTEAQ